MVGRDSIVKYSLIGHSIMEMSGSYLILPLT